MGRRNPAGDDDAVGSGVGRGAGNGPAGQELERWLAEAQVDDATDQRRRSGWLRRQAIEDATWVGVLADLAERRAPVAIETAADHRVVGVVHRVGHDVVGLRTAAGVEVLVALAGVASVHPAPDALPVVGEAAPAVELTLRGELRRWQEERPMVALMTRGGQSHRGRLVGVGGDVIALATGSGALYAPLASVVAVSEVDSG